MRIQISGMLFYGRTVHEEIYTGHRGSRDVDVYKRQGYHGTAESRHGVGKYENRKIGKAQ